MGRSMTDASLPARFSESDFRVGRVLNRTASVLSRNFLTFFVVTAVAHLPTAFRIERRLVQQHLDFRVIARFRRIHGQPSAGLFVRSA